MSGEAIRYVLILVVGVALQASPKPVLAQAQTAAANRAFDLEQAGRWRDAIAAWRQVIATGLTG